MTYAVFVPSDFRKGAAGIRSDSIQRQWIDCQGPFVIRAEWKAVENRQVMKRTRTNGLLGFLADTKGFSWCNLQTQAEGTNRSGLRRGLQHFLANKVI